MSLSEHEFEDYLGRSERRFERLADLNATLRDILRELGRRKLAGERLYGEPS
ncbi:hypothetical protein ACRS6B_17665 [Nocardia asteroides]